MAVCHYWFSLRAMTYSSMRRDACPFVEYCSNYVFTYMTVSIEIATTPNPPILETLISRYLAIIKFRFWFNLNLHQGIWVSEFGGFRCCSIFSGNSHVISPFQRGGLYQSCIHMYVFMFNVLLHVYMYIFFWSNQQILYLHAISLLSKGGLISFIMYIYVFMFNVFLHIFVNISGALHKFCMYIFTYIISLLSTGRITSFVYSVLHWECQFFILKSHLII